jgi:hypothetical protein
MRDFFKFYPKALTRGNKIYLSLKITESVKNIYQILTILNGKYPSRDKWVDKELEELESKPPKFRETIKKIIEPDNSIKNLKRKIKLLKTITAQVLEMAAGSDKKIMDDLKSVL